MSVENVELVLSLQLGSQDDATRLASDEKATGPYLATAAQALAPDFECTMQFPNTDPVTYTGGVDAFYSAWRDRLEHWTEYRAEIQGVIDADSKVIVFHRAYVRKTRDAPETIIEVASIWTIRDHRLASADFNVPQDHARAVAYSTDSQWTQTVPR